MSGSAAPWRSTVGTKILMAVTGIVLVAFVIGHMIGNLKAFAGAESFNAYAEFLRDVGYPALPHTGFLWIFRIVLLAAVGFHIWAAVTLTRTSQAARAIGYRKVESQVFSYASRTMRWGGVILLAFIVYHLLHMTTGQVHPDFRSGDAYYNLVAGFQSPIVVAAYLVAVAALSFHLHHGIWSMFQTLGAASPHYNGVRRPLASVIAVAVFLGFVSIPVAVQLGILS
jgi:succinate dehydrogenase / fumarate reductase cytochrome b subunit